MTTVTPPEVRSLPRINDPAPQFTAPSTHGELKLSDYKGKWVVLFSHPADFTPVCSTEFIGFAKAAGDFANLNTQLIGLSIDSVYSHIAWVRAIEDKFKVKVAFPVIADLSTAVAQAYGLIHPGASTTATVRAVFVIDPEQNVKAIIYYPLTTGRSVAEIKRLVQALQANVEKKLATPEGWVPGDQFIVPAPLTQADAEKRATSSDHDVTDWFFAKTKAPTSQAANQRSA
ncbi:MAG TPA: peroxiredoxin [Planctomycetota bacterium]|nr:peroxiredoxin [Planctomycetota bacterium]